MDEDDEYASSAEQLQSPSSPSPSPSPFAAVHNMNNTSTFMLVRHSSAARHGSVSLSTHLTPCALRSGVVHGLTIPVLRFRASCDSFLARSPPHAFSLLRALGTGAHGTVLLAECMDHSRRRVALKFVTHTAYPEVRVHATLRHECIVTMYGFFEYASYVVLVLEYCTGGDLFPFVIPLQPEMKVARIVHDVLQALRYLHNRRIVHGDIKAENVMLDANGMAKLADFGCAFDTRSYSPLITAGTLEFLAPEMSYSHQQQHQMHHSVQADMWSLGVMVFELLFGHLPFPEGYDYEHVSCAHIVYPHGSDVSDVGVDFVRRLLRDNRAHRMSSHEALGHRWILQYGRRRQ